MKSLALQAEPVAGLEVLGACELREQNWWRVRTLIQEATQADQDVALVLLGVTLYVDDEPIGVEALEAQPGRLAAPLSKALAQCMALYADSAAPALTQGSPPGER